MCKYCEDTSYERKEINIKEYSYPHYYGDLSKISLIYKFDILPYGREIKVIPHFCPMCGKKLEG